MGFDVFNDEYNRYQRYSTKARNCEGRKCKKLRRQMRKQMVSSIRWIFESAEIGRKPRIHGGEGITPNALRDLLATVPVREVNNFKNLVESKNPQNVLQLLRTLPENVSKHIYKYNIEAEEAIKWITNIYNASIGLR